jgi:hypothetical protein
MTIDNMIENLSNNSNLTDILKDDHLFRIEVVACNLNILITAFGTVSNGLSLYTFLHKKLRAKKINWYFLVLTLFEFIFCLMVLMDYGFTKIHHEQIFFHDLHDFSRIVFDYSIHTSQSCISLITLLLSLDRLYAIKNPMLIKEFITQHHCKKLISISLFTLILIKTSSFIFCEFSKTNMSFILGTILTPLFLSTIPLISVFVLNYLLIKEIVKSYRQKGLQSIISANYNGFRKKIVTSTTKKLLKKDSEKTLVTQMSSENNETKPSISNLENKREINFTKFDSLKSKRESDYSRNSLRLPEDTLIRKSSNRELKPVQKSHYLIIIGTNVWSIITSIPYSIFNYYLAYAQLFSSPDLIDIKTAISGQIISSIFYNSNYCFNFLVYLAFYADFRISIKNVPSGVHKYFVSFRNYIREKLFVL